MPSFDLALRRLLCGVPDEEAVELGSFLQVALWRELLDAAICCRHLQTAQM